MTQQETLAKFTQHADATKGIVFKVAAMYCSNPEDRKDMIQEIMVQLWRAYPRYNGQTKYATWVYRIAFNVAISTKRKALRQIPKHEADVEQLLAVPSCEDAALEEQLRFLQQCISSLPDLDKALIMLYLDEKSHKEIAEIMGFSLSNVGTRISRIKTTLKKLFSEI